MEANGQALLDDQDEVIYHDDTPSHKHDDSDDEEEVISYIKIVLFAASNFKFSHSSPCFVSGTFLLIQCGSFHFFPGVEMGQSMIYEKNVFKFALFFSLYC